MFLDSSKVQVMALKILSVFKNVTFGCIVFSSSKQYKVPGFQTFLRSLRKSFELRKKSAFVRFYIWEKIMENQNDIMNKE